MLVFVCVCAIGNVKILVPDFGFSFNVMYHECIKIIAVIRKRFQILELSVET